MKLVELKLNDYIEVLGSNEPAPGGGSASAVCGAQGIALTAMVAQLTIGKKKYAEHEELCKEITAKANELIKEFIVQVDVDTEAFNLVSAAYKLPKETDEDKAHRSAEIEKAMKIATEVPFKTMELALKSINLTKQLIGHSNTSAASDLGVSALNMVSCAKGAWLNVLINVGSLKDRELADKFVNDGKKIVAEIEKSANEVYSHIEGSLL